MKTFADLTEREVLAVAISSEEEDSRIYMTFAEDLKERYPDSAKLFEQMAEEERGHRHMLLELYEQRFGQHLPPIRREDVKGFLRRRPIWLTKNLPLDTIRKEVETMELEAERFYAKAAEQAEDVNVRRLLGDLAEAEKNHEHTAARLTDEILKPDVRAEEDRTRRRMFVLQYVQPGLAGLMDGSVSTLAPLFAAAFATHQNWQTFLVGLSAITSVTRLTIGPIRENPQARSVLQTVIGEAVAVGRALGVKLPEDYAAQCMTLVDQLPYTMTSSMFHDLEKGNRIELPWLSGGIVSLAGKAGLPVPANTFVAGVLAPFAMGVKPQVDVSTHRR